MFYTNFSIRFMQIAKIDVTLIQIVLFYFGKIKKWPNKQTKNKQFMHSEYFFDDRQLVPLLKAFICCRKRKRRGRTVATSPKIFAKSTSKAMPK